jgi:hypothetical protein
LGKKSVYKLVKEGKIPDKKVLNKWRFGKEALETTTTHRYATNWPKNLTKVVMCTSESAPKHGLPPKQPIDSIEIAYTCRGRKFGIWHGSPKNL